MVFDGALDHLQVRVSRMVVPQIAGRNGFCNGLLRPAGWASKATRIPA